MLASTGSGTVKLFDPFEREKRFVAAVVSVHLVKQVARMCGH